MTLGRSLGWRLATARSEATADGDTRYPIPAGRGLDRCWGRGGLWAWLATARCAHVDGNAGPDSDCCRSIACADRDTGADGWTFAHAHNVSDNDIHARLDAEPNTCSHRFPIGHAELTPPPSPTPFGWVELTSFPSYGADTNVTGIAYGGSRFVAVGWSSRNGSTRGRVWTSR